MRKLVLLALLAATPGFSQTSLCAQLQALTQDSQSRWGISVTTLDGAPVCQLNSAQLFRPASNAKLFTAITALSLFGPQQVFETDLVADRQPAPTLEGNLTLRGGGDAYLSERSMPYKPPSEAAPRAPKPRNPIEDLADAVAATGIRHVTGDIVGEDTIWPYEPYVPSWELEDATDSDGAPVSALSIDDNTVALTLTAGSDPASFLGFTFHPEEPYYRVEMQAKAVADGRPAQVRLDKRPGSPLVEVYGTLPLGKSYTDELSIDDPALFAAQTLKSLLESRGLVIDGQARAEHRPPNVTASFLIQINQPLTLRPMPQGVPLSKINQPQLLPVIARHVSPSLIEDVTLTLKVSQNLHAELLLHLLGQQFAEQGSTAQSARVIRQFVIQAAHVAAGDFLLYDGSGLSSHDLVTPRSITQLLVYAATEAWFPQFKAALPIGGVDGSLQSRFSGQDEPQLKGMVFAKTGSLGESRALSGYLTCATGHTLVFSILEDNHLPGSTADRTLMDHIVALIAAAN
jgi:D-alanyl-D-alanine carboxypeptidase/D-alanyl-D-alanine-endopeptidase (penicillin-binding protein 4)